MPSYRVEFTAPARKELSKLTKNIQPKQLGRIKTAIDALAEDPRPVGSEKIETRDYLRIRVGDYRIVYQVEEEILTVLIIRIGHRREVYRKI